MWCSTPRRFRLRRVEPEVEFTSLDKPLFDGADATKGDLVAYLEAVADQLIGQLRDRPLSVMRARPGQRPFMQKNVPKNAPDWIETVGDLGGDVQARGALRALQRPADAALVRQPARRRVPPDAVAADARWCSTSTRRRARRSTWCAATALLVREALAAAGLEGAIKTSGSKGVHIFVPVTAGGEEIAHATRALAARTAALDPSIATTAYVVEEREGKVFVGLHARGRRDRRRRLLPAHPPRRAGLVPGELGRARAHLPRGLHHPHRPGPAGRPRPVDGGDARAAGPARPISSRRAARSRSPASPRCTRASAASAPQKPKGAWPL